ncbi:hypothetical protein FRC08_015152 [Ceratobasidium sp. 394]|nr:hypothetical protein FRC08_015152 [Ceratobasidium sp. 394]
MAITPPPADSCSQPDLLEPEFGDGWFSIDLENVSTVERDSGRIPANDKLE